MRTPRRAEWEKEYRKKRRPILNKVAVDKKREVKQRAVAYLGGKCETCGYAKSIRALTFHHRDPSTKSFNISQIKDHAWTKIILELDKCDLLCFNCHMELEEQEQNYEEPYFWDNCY